MVLEQLSGSQPKCRVMKTQNATAPPPYSYLPPVSNGTQAFVVGAGNTLRLWGQKVKMLAC